MVAPNVKCVVLEVPSMTVIDRFELTRPARELLPWADPYIAGLVAKVKAQIVADREAREEEADEGLRGEAPLPWSNEDLPFEDVDFTRWPR